MALSGFGIVLLSRWAPALRLVDVPGGRKAHPRSVPLVGGIAIFIALVTTMPFTVGWIQASWFLLALSFVMAAGFWDDVSEIRPALKLAIELLAAALMIWGARVELHSVGDLFGWRPIGLAAFVVPMTMFAIVGVVNAVNMIDGLDGLGGSIAFVAFAWYASVARLSGLDMLFETCLILCGAIVGFLLFNVRFRRQGHARVFLGDTGSLMIGFALGWLAIDLTQGAGRSFPPIAALWVVLLPLADCVSLMARRVSSGRSPVEGDRRHIHHYLLARGLTHNQVVGLLVGVSGLFGAVGFAGWRFQVPEPLLFWVFFGGFFAYHAWIQRAWKRLEAADTAASPGLSLEDPDELRVAGG